MNKDTAEKIIQKTIADYNRIAHIWSNKRWRAPSDMLALRKYLNTNDKVLDFGCGNGIFYEAIKDLKIDYTGTDASLELIKICTEKYPNSNFILSDPFKLPFLKKDFDKIFCLSVIHHIPSALYRQNFLTEISRILKDDGLLVISAWNIENSQMARWWEENKNKFRSELSQFEAGDLLYPFKSQSGNTEAYRYLHCFSQSEFKQLLEDNGFIVEKVQVIARGKGTFSNLIAFARKRI